jgi:hypothetical protein
MQMEELNQTIGCVRVEVQWMNSSRRGADGHVTLHHPHSSMRLQVALGNWKTLPPCALND